MVKISASVLNADLAQLADVAKFVENAGADMVHFDVMDGSFVDNLTFGMPVLQCMKKYTDTPFDVHLMIRDPLHYAKRFADAGADLLSFHIESDSDVSATIQAIHDAGIVAGIALSPDTPVSTVYPFLEQLNDNDFILLMTVHPGFGKQSFLPYVLDKIRELRDEISRRKLNLHIEVDGGIQDETAAECVAAGADFLVSGSYLMSSAAPAEAVKRLRG